MTDHAFTRNEALTMWARLVAGWADHLNESGTRTLIDGIPATTDAGGSYEGVARMLWGLGSWLSYPERPAEISWRGVAYNLESLTRRALVNGCDPTLADSWLEAPPRTSDQRTVESGQIAFAVWQTRERIWSWLSDHDRSHIVGFLDTFGQRPQQWTNNWALFWLLNHTARKALQVHYDQQIIEDVLIHYLDRVYHGDGWYDDAETRGPRRFDHYITWVFASHVLAWAEMDGASLPERRDVLLERVRAWMQPFPYFFAANGSTVEYGRSLAYKFARLGAPLWAYKLGAWPHSAGMLKRLVGQHLRWYFDNGAVRADNTLRQTLTEPGSPEVLERYISTGATYWAIQAFSGLWSLRDDDPFWTAEEEPLPAEQGSYTRLFPIPGWILSGRRGHVELFHAAGLRDGYGNKYSKLVYSTRHPFNAGLDGGFPSLDNTLCLTENGIRAQREQVTTFAIGEPGWLRARYPIVINDHTHTVDTTLLLLGHVHLRAHRLVLAPDTAQVTVEEGSAAFGYNAGQIPSFRRVNGWLLFGGSGSYVGFRPLKGYTTAPRVVTGSPNSVYGYNVLAVLSATLGSLTGAGLNSPTGQNLGIILTPSSTSRQHELICAALSGNANDRDTLPSIEQAGWDAAGQFVARVDGAVFTVPALPD